MQANLQPSISITHIQTSIEQGMFELAIRQCDEVLANFPKQGEVHFIKGNCLQQLGEMDKAVLAFQQAATLLPNKTQPLLRLARIAALRSRASEEIDYAGRIYALDKSQNKIFARLIQLLIQISNFEAALNLLEQNQHNILPNQLGFSYVCCLNETGNKNRALDFALKCLQESAWSIELMHLALGVAEEVDELEKLVQVLEELLKQNPSSKELCIGIGRGYFKLDKISQAEDYLKAGVEHYPNDATAWHDLAVLQRQTGKIEASQTSLEKCLEVDPYNASALRVRGYELKYSYGDKHSHELFKAAARMEEYEPGAQSQMHYAQAKYFEDVGDLEVAFEHYKKAGQIQKRIAPWSELRMRNVLMTMRQYLQPNDFLQAAQQGGQSDKPVFIFGMPRSGTSLLEQVISSHPDAFGAGELKLASAVINQIKVGRVTLETQMDGVNKLADHAKDFSIAQRGEEYLQQVEALADGEYRRIVDKMPGNYHWVGLLATILPNAHFIHSRRHPVEICLSEYRIFFPDGINFSYDLRDLGKAYRQYHEFMQYWTEVLPEERILHVRYEDMVADLETQARRIIDYIDLPWNDNCLKFYENKRKVKTASVSQVRKPIYTSSVNRWQKYKPYLQPLIEELGPLIGEYESELS